MTAKPRGKRPPDYFRDPFGIKQERTPKRTVFVKPEAAWPHSYEIAAPDDQEAARLIAQRLSVYVATGAIKEQVWTVCGGKKVLVT